MASILASAAVGTAAALYLDGRYSIRRDIKQVRADKKFKKRVDDAIASCGDEVTFYKLYTQAQPDASAFWFEGKSWTYRETLQLVDSLAALLQHKGIKDGETVGVFMSNTPEIMFTQLALSRIGAIPALINTALRNETLMHCLKVAKSNRMLCTPDLVHHLEESAVSKVVKTPTIINIGSFDPFTARSSAYEITPAILSVYSHNTSPPAKKKLSDTAALMYTSGTSGNPKAVSIKCFHMVLVSVPLQMDVDRWGSTQNTKSRIYSCLPLFHGTGLFTGPCQAVGCSGTFIIGRKFSASRFSQDLFDSGATKMLYVGELCRYLLKAPPSPYDKKHNCRIASGNGLSLDIWEKFMKRYNITEIREFYRSTEGVARFDNFAGGAESYGRCGFAGPVARRFNEHTYIVKFDAETQQPYRDSNGRCVKAKLGELGEAVGRVNSMATYHEYLDNPTANEEKLIKDVFAPGDIFQRSGDLLVHDQDGWVRFVERAGDSYRWKGENVSAGEVKSHLSKLPGVNSVEVYGVKLPGYDGQAGAAAIVLNDPSPHGQRQFLDGLYQRLSKQGLTIYQIPRLVRFIEAITVNATFKHLKKDIKARPWEPSKTKDSLWWLDDKTYKPLNEPAWVAIQGGKARL